MKVGDVLKYTNLDEEEILGLVVGRPSHNPDAEQLSVKVHWFDDATATHENVKDILDPEMIRIEVYIESR
jgi:hypothetical protein